MVVNGEFIDLPSDYEMQPTSGPVDVVYQFYYDPLHGSEIIDDDTNLFLSGGGIRDLYKKLKDSIFKLAMSVANKKTKKILQKEYNKEKPEKKATSKKRKKSTLGSQISKRAKKDKKNELYSPQSGGGYIEQSRSRLDAPYSGESDSYQYMNGGDMYPHMNGGAVGLGRYRRQKEQEEHEWKQRMLDSAKKRREERKRKQCGGDMYQHMNGGDMYQHGGDMYQHGGDLYQHGGDLYQHGGDVYQHERDYF